MVIWGTFEKHKAKEKEDLLKRIEKHNINKPNKDKV
jgi:hypothetical protein